MKIIALQAGQPEIRDAQWTVVRETADGAIDVAALPAAPVLVPLSVWQAHRAELAARGAAQIGVWLAPDDDPFALADELDAIGAVGVDFPTFKDGRGYSTATLLRTRLNWTGALIAVGDVLHDQIALMGRCGFDQFAMRADQDLDHALTAFGELTVKYQRTVDNPTPLFRRRAELAKAGAA